MCLILKEIGQSTLIGISDTNTNRDGFALWSDIQIHWLCHTIKFQNNLPNIGWKYVQSYSDKAKKQAEQLTAPLTLNIPVILPSETNHISCKKQDIRQIKLTFDHLYFHYKSSSGNKKKNKEIIWKTH